MRCLRWQRLGFDVDGDRRLTEKAVFVGTDSNTRSNHYAVYRGNPSIP
jgi:hypothetical protein